MAESFLLTNAATGTPEKDCSVVVVLRHDAIPYALQSDLWAKYKLGELFKAHDPATKELATHNPFWKPKEDFKIPGVGAVPIGINQLQDNGVLFLCMQYGNNRLQRSSCRYDEDGRRNS